MWDHSLEFVFLMCLGVANVIARTECGVSNIVVLQKDWREDYNGTFKKKVLRCVRKSQDPDDF